MYRFIVPLNLTKTFRGLRKILSHPLLSPNPRLWKMVYVHCAGVISFSKCGVQILDLRTEYQKGRGLLLIWWGWCWCSTLHHGCLVSLAKEKQSVDGSIFLGPLTGDVRGKGAATGVFGGSWLSLKAETTLPTC